MKALRAFLVILTFGFMCASASAEESDPPPTKERASISNFDLRLIDIATKEFRKRKGRKWQSDHVLIEETKIAFIVTFFPSEQAPDPNGLELVSLPGRAGAYEVVIDPKTLKVLGKGVAHW